VKLVKLAQQGLEVGTFYLLRGPLLAEQVCLHMASRRLKLKFHCFLKIWKRAVSAYIQRHYFQHGLLHRSV